MSSTCAMNSMLAKGSVSVAISHSTTPYAHTSLAGEYVRCSSCSGAIHLSGP
eukprot:CAMPEP_0198325296 /NCGR_PEP_ID=MMETSP1450-20131203/13073_1 /TAXON_ID=753684 ORGANISM="Madagascaria erythrocladiodes, Strain CCMP3234" /NCGR_SAMPLE_ID=MMETSP1450 /ASSEMBLY_ACC=CAM_ASM_001115 /LENGTH=51 /DNA_ID=CAMNT_0044029165 /DNA_START=18 /DNA_END=169 /DNA_ORIENTATION=+